MKKAIICCMLVFILSGCSPLLNKNNISSNNSSAFSAILVYATDLMPGKVGMIAGVFFGLMFGLGGLGSAFFGWLADRTSIEFIFRVSTLLPLLGIITGFLPNIELKRDEK